MLGDKQVVLVLLHESCETLDAVQDADVVAFAVALVDCVHAEDGEDSGDGCGCVPKDGSGFVGVVGLAGVVSLAWSGAWCNDGGGVTGDDDEVVKIVVAKKAVGVEVVVAAAVAAAAGAEAAAAGQDCGYERPTLSAAAGTYDAEDYRHCPLSWVWFQLWLRWKYKTVAHWRLCYRLFDCKSCLDEAVFEAQVCCLSRIILGLHVDVELCLGCVRQGISLFAQRRNNCFESPTLGGLTETCEVCSIIITP